jgi:chaperone modulatory protein CbpM
MKDDTFSGLLLDEHTQLSLYELSQACDVHAEWIIELVNEGILEPQGMDMRHWQFSGISLRKTQTCIRLKQDLDLNLPGVALAVQLLEEIETLRNRLRAIDPDFDNP